jgi:hypothetical protein
LEDRMLAERHSRLSKFQCLFNVRLGQAELPRDPRGSDASLKSCKDGVQLPTCQAH